VTLSISSALTAFPAMKYEAVVFDLFGTLCHQFSLNPYLQVVRRMAAELGADPDEFTRLWFESGKLRGSSALTSIRASLELLVAKMGLKKDAEKILKAAETRLDYVRGLLVPLPYALDTLHKLRARKMRVGLLSNCSVDVPEVWDETPFGPLLDAVVFSCQAGLSKPDLRIYQLVAERLEVQPQTCLYVGDGSSQELTGALKAGMHPVLIRNTDYDASGETQTDSEVESWKGPQINSLRQVMELVE
jgi:putative hydrolase of the HAD superfamily